MLDQLMEDSGHAAQHRPSRKGASAAQLAVEGMVIEQQILKLIEQDPIGAAKAWIGRRHLQDYGFLLGSLEAAEAAAGCKLFSPGTRDEVVAHWAPYKVKFELGDVLLESKWIIAQMAAEDCWAGEDEADPAENPWEWSPWTTDAFIGLYMGPEGGEDRPIVDPFASDYRPAVTIEQYDEKGNVVQSARLDGAKPDRAPAEGFRELTDADG